MNKEEEITELLESGKIEVAGFSDAIRGQVKSALKSIYTGSGKARTTIDQFIDTSFGKTSQIIIKQGSNSVSVPSEGEVLLNPNAPQTHFLTPEGEVVNETIKGVLIHELGARPFREY